MDGGCSKNHNVSSESEERKLELRLAPPGEENWSKERDSSLSSLGHFSPTMNNNGNKAHSFSSFENPPVGAVLSSPWAHTLQHNQTKAPSFLQFPSKESSQPSKVADLQNNAEKKAFLPSAHTAVPVTNKRTAPAPVVGWPPVRLLRRNLAGSSSSKPAPESPNAPPHKESSEKPRIEASSKGLFVKINMDGVPIGRKVDLKAYDSYEKLSSAVDELFRGLLAAQNDSSAGGIVNKREGEKATKGILDGSGEYTLVYEDNEGDRMLVGDVPWHMFVSTVKRLRVLNSSELPALSREC